MPWDLGSQSGVWSGSRSGSQSERQCERTSFAFYRAVRDLLPVWLLEDMRTMEVFHWEDGRACAFTPSEALLYAVVHDHQQYARYLLNRYSVSALGAPGRSFCCCPASGAPHLSVAVRYNRISVLGMIVDALKDFSTESARRNYLDSRGGCAHSAEAGKTAVHLACDLVRPECLLLLLVHGACPYLTDSTRESPLDCLLQRMRQDSSNMVAEARGQQVCVGYLLLFMPKLPRLPFLQQEPQLWQRLLGNEAFRWLAGLAPPSLFVQAMQTLTRAVPGQLDALPDFLKPLDFRLSETW
ncbi:ankyrin repeat domain-containing protein 9 [Centroberyx gerrardi]|uniref:ankyrin repeat domain-containing protein 9 n=1 Tax=Centroberyx gerrardi TaxID=166262 RepID=UPI003AAB5329